MGDKKFIVTTKPGLAEEKSVTMTIRIERELQQELDKLATQSNRSRNELIALALKFAVDNIEIRP